MAAPACRPKQPRSQTWGRLESPSPKIKPKAPSLWGRKPHRDELASSHNLLVLLPIYPLAMRSLAMVPSGGLSGRGTRAWQVLLSVPPGVKLKPLLVNTEGTVSMYWRSNHSWLRVILIFQKCTKTFRGLWLILDTRMRSWEPLPHHRSRVLPGLRLTYLLINQAHW